MEKMTISEAERYNTHYFQEPVVKRLELEVRQIIEWLSNEHGYWTNREFYSYTLLVFSKTYLINLLSQLDSVRCQRK